MITKEDILTKTHYGLNIYSHILRRFYPDEIVMHLVGRDCGWCRNPFANGEPTLHIWIMKYPDMIRPIKQLPAEKACHEDTSRTIADGDAFDFAELYYHQSGDELLQTLNKELHLNLDENHSFYNHTAEEKSVAVIKKPSPQFSFFRAPITNVKPYRNITLSDAYKYIVSDYAKERTAKLRSISDVKKARAFKAEHFDYCTFSGIFSKRSDKLLVRHSGLICIDFDHLKNLETVFNRLVDDEHFETQLLFRSPSGDGLKWIVTIDITEQIPHAKYFKAISNYLQKTYNLEADKSGRDIPRACFLPHDSQAYINPTIQHDHE